MALPLNSTIARIPHFAALVAGHPRACVGWGRKSSGRRAVALARLLGRPFLLLEDGFLRSLGRNDPPLSLLLDDLGCYYDASAPSRMEATIATGPTAAEATRARALVGQWRASGLSKYNHAADYAGPLPARYVLVADQCHGDLSVGMGLANAASFAAMLTAALTEYPDHLVLVKTHPDVLARQARGWFSADQLPHPRIRLIADGCHPVRLVRDATAVYTVTSLIGFEALLHGRPLRCFGMPFYAGWGLSADWLAPPPRRHPASLEALVHGAFVALARHVDPASGRLWSAEQAIAHAAQARAASQTPASPPAFPPASLPAASPPAARLPCTLAA